MPRTLILLAAVLSVMVGCATTAERASLPPGSWRMESGQICEDLGSPERPAAVDEVADPGALRGILSEHSFFREAAGDTALISIQYDSTGALTRAWLHHPATTAEQEDRFEQLLKRHVAPSAAPRTQAWLLAVRTPGFVLAPIEAKFACEPWMRTENRRALARLLERSENLDLLGNRRAVLRVFLDADGTVKRTRVTRSSGSIRADQRFAELLQTVRFEPALIDGVPVAVWIELPVAVAVREPVPPATNRRVPVT
jgi:TonB family protein